VFLKVVEHKSVTKASEDLFMTQPAASIQLKKFQEQFDIPLTEIVNRRVHVTEFGYEIATIAKRILDEVGEMQYTSNAFKGLVSGKLRISSASTGKYLIPYYLSGYLKQHPGIDLFLDVSNREKVIHDLLNNEIDFAFISQPIDEPNLVQEQLMVENVLFMFVSANEEETDIEKMPIILRENGSATRNQTEKYLSKSNINPPKILELTSNEAVKQAVCAGLGCSIMPILGSRDEISTNLINVLPMKGLPIKTQWRLVWLKQKSLSPAAKGFLNYLEVKRAEINRIHFEPFLKA
jgi:DNA-binding transcriptional LysR family regulator